MADEEEPAAEPLWKARGRFGPGPHFATGAAERQHDTTSYRMPLLRNRSGVDYDKYGEDWDE